MMNDGQAPPTLRGICNTIGAGEIDLGMGILRRKIKPTLFISLWLRGFVRDFFQRRRREPMAANKGEPP